MKKDQAGQKFVLYYEPMETIYEAPELKYGELRKETDEAFILEDGSSIPKNVLEGMLVVDSKELAEKAIESYDRNEEDLNDDIEEFVKEQYFSWLSQIETTIGKEFKTQNPFFIEVLPGN